MIWAFLSQLNKWLLPSIHKVQDLTQLSSFQKAIVGWKMWVTYKHLDTLKERGKGPLNGESRPH